MEGRSIPGGNPAVLVYAYVRLFPNTTIQSIEPYVVNITDHDDENHIAAAWIDTTKIDTLAALEGIKSIQKVISPELRAGSIVSEGDAIHKTANVRSQYGYRGAGVKIGVISNGVDHISQSQATGDLPPGVHVLSNTIGGDEGTAMLEIVHDMAPDAELYFHDWGSNILAFDSAIDDLKNAGCTVIVDDVGWYTEPYFEDGIVATHVKTLLSENKIVYVSATGNDAKTHYQGVYYNDGNDLMDFSQGTSSYKNLYAHIPPAGSVKIAFEWNDPWEASANDYDLGLWHTASSTYLTTSRNPQTGTQNPFEALTYTNTGSSAIDAEIVVANYLGLAETRTIELYIIPSGGSYTYTDNIVAADSVFGQPGVPDVIAVAAAPASSPSTIESDSSHGPVTITYPSPGIRQKPDITGIDGVSITGAGGFSNPFYGTSAAAPHIAAIVAQIWGAHPALTPAQVRNALYSSAVDLGTAGKDTTFGYGRADALAIAVATSSPAPTVTSIIPATGQNTTTISITNLAGTGFYGTPTVNLTKSGKPNITATGVTVIDPTKVTCTFDLTGKTVGLWNVVVSNPDGKEVMLLNGFTITTSLIGRDIGVFRSGQWILDYGMDRTVDRRFPYGLAGDIPIAGDFNNDGTTDIGVFRSGQWILDYGMDRTVDRRFQYGLAGDIPIAGDFNNDGTTDIGVFRSGQWILDYGMDRTVDRRFQYGLAGDIPVVGDFNNVGTTDIGVFRSGQWILDYGMDRTVDRRFQYGLAGDIPIAGDFNNDGTTDIGVFRSGQWILDYGMDRTVDLRLNYGLATDIPVVGIWTIPVPVVTGVSPHTGSTLGGETVTITGTGFTGVTNVYFGSMGVSDFTSSTDTQIVLNTPAGSAGTVDITVKTPAGTSAVVSADTYTYITPVSQNEILDSHNVYRNEVGVVPLAYNTTLAASAQAWAEHDASIGMLVHSDPNGNYGENIARWTVGYSSWTDIVNLWASEKQYFIYGPLGDGSSTTGHWYDVGHYTQIVWGTTTECGCGKATNVTQNAEYFVCQYWPAGNYWGQNPY